MLGSHVTLILKMRVGSCQDFETAWVADRTETKVDRGKEHGDRYVRNMEDQKDVGSPRGCKRSHKAIMPETEHEPVRLRFDYLPDLGDREDYLETILVPSDVRLAVFRTCADGVDPIKDPRLHVPRVANSLRQPGSDWKLPLEARYRRLCLRRGRKESCARPDH